MLPQKHPVRADKGQNLVEFSVILAVVAGVCIATTLTLSTTVQNQLTATMNFGASQTPAQGGNLVALAAQSNVNSPGGTSSSGLQSTAAGNGLNNSNIPNNTLTQINALTSTNVTPTNAATNLPSPANSLVNNIQSTLNTLPSTFSNLPSSLAGANPTNTFSSAAGAVGTASPGTSSGGAGSAGTTGTNSGILASTPIAVTPIKPTRPVVTAGTANNNTLTGLAGGNSMFGSLPGVNTSGIIPKGLSGVTAMAPGPVSNTNSGSQASGGTVAKAGGGSSTIKPPQPQLPTFPRNQPDVSASNGGATSFGAGFNPQPPTPVVSSPPVSTGANSGISTMVATVAKPAVNTNSGMTGLLSSPPPAPIAGPSGGGAVVPGTAFTVAKPPAVISTPTPNTGSVGTVSTPIKPTVNSTSATGLAGLTTTNQGAVKPAASSFTTFSTAGVR